MELIKKHVERNIIGSTEEYFVGVKTGEKYHRIVGGLAWPGSWPGYCVVIAELNEKNETHNKRPYKILHEYENQNPSTLMKRCSELSVICCAEPFYTDTTDRGMMSILQRSGLRLHTRGAPLIDDSTAFETYLLMIRELIGPAKKLLHFGNNSTLRPQLDDLNPQDIPTTAKAAFRIYPQLTALGFAICGLETFPYDPQEDRRIEQEVLAMAEQFGD